MELFAAAFFVLALDSFLFGVVAGEQVCMRAHTEGMVAAGLLGIGAVAIFIGLAWLFDIYENGDGDLARLSRLLVYVTEAVVVLMLTVTAFGLMNDLAEVKGWGVAAPPVWSLWTANTLILLLMATASRLRPRDTGRERALRTAAYSTIVCSLIGAAIFSAASTLSRREWEPLVPTVMVAVAISTSLLLPTLALVALARTLPAPSRSTKYGNEPAPSHGVAPSAELARTTRADEMEAKGQAVQKLES